MNLNRNLLIGLGALGAVVLLLLLSAFFTVHQTQQALILQFGRPIRVVQEPGLHLKVPFVQNAVYFDRRVLDYDAAAAEVILGDQKRLVVDSFLRYRIDDPLRFYQAVQTERELRDRIDAVLDASMREALGQVPLFTVLSADRSALMGQIRDQVNEQATNFGIDVIDVRLKRADLPPENSQAVYRRMQTEREREAKELRAQGAELATRIRARADRERRVLIAEAMREAQVTRGEGDAQAVRIFGEAFGQDEDFFVFYRSMQAYREAFQDQNTSFVLSPDSEFFRFFGGSVPQQPRPVREAGAGAGQEEASPVDAATATDGVAAAPVQAATGGVMPTQARDGGVAPVQVD
jgi:modulator of FtsH protease HflC